MTPLSNLSRPDFNQLKSTAPDFNQLKFNQLKSGQGRGARNGYAERVTDTRSAYTGGE